MRLIAFSIEGYKRFAAKSSLKLHGPMIAIVGPNEAGKSTLLEALALVNDDSPIDPRTAPRRTEKQPLLEWQFELEESDSQALNGIPDIAELNKVVISKGPDGKRQWHLLPHSPGRDLTARADALKLMMKYRGNDFLAKADESADQSFDLESFDDVANLLEQAGDYPESSLASIRAMVNTLRHLRSSTSDIKFPSVVANKLDELLKQEMEPSPWSKAVKVLEGRVPDFQRFAQEDRELHSQYDLEEVAENPPGALSHLATLAALNLKALRNEAVGNAVADVTTRCLRANARLKQRFEQTWNQQAMSIQIDVQGTILYIQATTPADNGVSDISERSDGMRWFAALLAFAHGWKKRPILLVDELETHLHYDAQADLVNVLSRQEFTSKVIYSTHSFGCLPNDLGLGVRVVEQQDDDTSRLENGFWKGGAGFSPLLASMGAAAVSITPTRHAVIAEGPADAILLPTLLRQANSLESLDFQIAPGLASVAEALAAGLQDEAGRVVFLTDSDEAGLSIGEKLTRAGISRSHIIVLPGRTPMETEDLVDAEIYAHAVNQELRCWNPPHDPLPTALVPNSLRSSSLKLWCEANRLFFPDKRAVAQRIVDESSTETVFASSAKEESNKPTQQDTGRP